MKKLTLLITQNSSKFSKTSYTIRKCSRPRQNVILIIVITTSFHLLSHHNTTVVEPTLSKYGTNS